MKKIIIVSVVLFLVLGIGTNLTAQEEAVTPVYLENNSLVDCLESDLHPVYRKVDKSRPIGSTIEELLNINIDIYEAAIGFRSEWSDSHQVELLGVNLDEDGLLTIELSDPDRFTSGGSYRVRLLRAQIEKSVLQFKAVDQVKFIGPDHLFQP